MEELDKVVGNEAYKVLVFWLLKFNKLLSYIEMESAKKTRVCNRCGNEMTAFSPSLPTLSKLQKVTPSEYAEKISELENVSLNVANEWVHHKSFSQCLRKVAFCPFCGGELKSWRATLCLHCNKSWHEQGGTSAT